MQIHSQQIGTGHYVPEQIVTNNDLTAFMETSVTLVCGTQNNKGQMS